MPVNLNYLVIYSEVADAYSLYIDKQIYKAGLCTKINNLHKIKDFCTKIIAVAQKTDIVPIYQLPNCKPITLLDMLRFYAEKLVNLTTYFARLSIVCANTKELNDDNEDIETLEKLETLCKDIGLEYSARQASRIKGIAQANEEPPTPLPGLINDLETRIYDELSSRVCFVIGRNKAGFYDKINLFGEDVFNKFPSANFDIEEAGKCFALARYTACVMHLMRCLEVALRAIGTALSVSLTNPNWQNIINQANSAITTNKSTLGIAWKAEADFYTNVTAHLFTVKNAWRNPTMHVERKYTEEEAEDIFNAVKGLMRHIAKHLDEKGNFTP